VAGQYATVVEETLAAQGLRIKEMTKLDHLVSSVQIHRSDVRRFPCACGGPAGRRSGLLGGRGQFQICAVEEALEDESACWSCLPRNGLGDALFCSGLSGQQHNHRSKARFGDVSRRGWGSLGLASLALLLSACTSCGGQCSAPYELGVQFIPKTPLATADAVLQRCGRDPEVTSVGKAVTVGDGVSAVVWTRDIDIKKMRPYLTCLRSSPSVEGVSCNRASCGADH
jgi:hypothetical protein